MTPELIPENVTVEDTTFLAVPVKRRPRVCMYIYVNIVLFGNFDVHHVLIFRRIYT